MLSWRMKNLNESRLFTFCALFLCVKSFCKKKSEFIPNNLIYITTLLSQSFSIITIFFYYHNNFPLSQYFSIIKMIFHYHNLFPLLQYLSMITILFDYPYLYENEPKYEFHHLIHIFYHQNMIMIFCQFHRFLFYAF